jgi:hypothetical protein
MPGRGTVAAVDRAAGKAAAPVAGKAAPGVGKGPGVDRVVGKVTGVDRVVAKVTGVDTEDMAEAEDSGAHIHSRRVSRRTPCDVKIDGSGDGRTYVQTAGLFYAAVPATTTRSRPWFLA